ncbi:MAG TPA: tRNA pseudouridine(55) synthase TruB [Burkholderiales bacterium]
MNAPRRPPRQRIDGVLFIDKPPGLTSNGVLSVIKRLYNAEKAGHTGTLDPFATGLLPVALGDATKFSGHLLDADKTYLATMRLGVTTTTADLEGEVRQTRPVNVDDAQLHEALRRHSGAIAQIPPMYSALKRDGKPLYEYARAGETLEREPRQVTIHALDLIERKDEFVTFRVACSKGTYVRTLAEDIGETLDCGAHLTALRREATGGFSLEGALPLDRLQAMEAPALLAALRPVDALIIALPRLELDTAQAARLRQGQRLPFQAPPGPARAYDPEGQFLGVVRVADGVAHPERLALPPA